MPHDNKDLLELITGIVSIVRLAIVMSIESSDRNVTYNLKDLMLRSTVEISIGLICACLPSMRQFLKIIGLNRIFSSVRGSSKNTPGEVGNSHNPSGVINPSNQASQGNGSRGGFRSEMLSSIRTGLNNLNKNENRFQMIDVVSKAHTR